MKIALNTRLLQLNKLEGIGTFMDEVLKRVVKANPNIQFHFIFDRPYSKEFIYAKNVIPHVIFPPTKHVLLFDFWFNYKIAKLVKKINADYFLSLDAITSTKLKIPNHLVIHDINFVHRPLDLPKFPRNYYLNKTPIFCETTTQLATVSNYSKQDLIKEYSVAEDKIDVVYNAAKSSFSPVSDTEKVSIQKKYSNGENYFVYVGSLHPRKNLNNLILAFDEFKKQHQQSFKLLVVGNVMWETAGINETLNQCNSKNDIVFTGRKPDEELVKIMAAAHALTYLPFFEGFGIPIVEAYASGIPVICSNTTCLPEIAGNGALYAAPENIKEIAQQMKKMADSPELRTELIAEGSKIVQQYDWDKTAELYWKSVQKIFK